METENKVIGPSLFFCVNGELLFHGCSLAEGEEYGDFLNYPHSHYKIWEENYKQRYKVDFDYYPRGRVVYRKSDDSYLIYFDKCMEEFITAVTEKYTDKSTILCYDEHYQCHMCNEYYVI